MDPPVVPTSQRQRFVRDYTSDEQIPQIFNGRPSNRRQYSNGYTSPGPGNRDERLSPERNYYGRSPSRQDAESVITQIRSPEAEHHQHENGVLDDFRDDRNIAEKVADSFGSPSPDLQRENLRNFDFSLDRIDEQSGYARSLTSASVNTGISASSNSRMPDFFGHEVFQTVLHNPTTAHQLLLFSQSRLCGENMEFLEKVDRYHQLLNEVTKTMFEIHRDYISVSAPNQINIPEGILLRINKDLKSTLTSMLPKLESLFNDSQNEIERLVSSDVYPRFVRYQMTMSASKALATDRGKYAGLGDCFVLTSPSKADNPILYASDGFVKVTGYSRSDIIPRNCRFLQGRHTDRSSVKRIKTSLDTRTESVELLLNYKKNGEPFWNLLYTTPLYDSSGQLAFFLGGQINCSTTIHNASDILRILSFADDVEEDPANIVTTSTPEIRKGGFFSIFRGKPSAPPRAPGMESGLLNKIERMNIKTQMDEFYTAYSRFIVINATTMYISFHSVGILTLLYPSKQPGSQLAPLAQNLTPNGLANATPQQLQNHFQVLGTDIFRFLNQHTFNSLPRDYKAKVKAAVKAGNAISIELQLCTRRTMGFEKFVTHWTPLKDDTSKAEFVVLTLGSQVK